MKGHVETLDTSLRDGAQGRGVAYSVSDRLRLCALLDELGVDIIEAGNPASNPRDREFFEQVKSLPLTHAKLCAFGATRYKDRPVEEDEGVLSLCAAGTPYVTVFGKAWTLHVERILHTTKEENLAMVADTVRYCTARGREVIFDAEHFFDGYLADAGYAMAVLRAAQEAGARTLVLCDTNGGTLCDAVARITQEVISHVNIPVGIHCHNDTAMAVASTVLAVEAGARHIQGVALGYGERAGNTELFSAIADLQLKLGYDVIPQASMERLAEFARRIAEVNSMSVEPATPYVGRNAFAHKGGMHIDGVLKAAGAFEHVSPESVGNRRDFLLSEFSGRAALVEKMSAAYPQLREDRGLAGALTQRLKELEHQGYTYEGAEASFELVVRRQLAAYQPFFKVDYYKVMSEQPDAHTGVSAMAMVKVDVEGQKQVTAYEGMGPVNALDGAMRKALKVFYPDLSDVYLVDYKVRVLDSTEATASSVRVVIESSDGVSAWSTVGVSTDVIHASLLALVDSVEYKLLG